MKNIILVLVICILSSQATVTKHESDREHEGFVGPVKKMVSIWTPISGSNYPPGSKCRHLTYEYDQTGRITRLSVYPGSCGSDEIRSDYTYSADGTKTTKRQEISGKNSPSPPPPAAAPPNAKRGPAKETRRYDDSGRLVEMAMMLPNGEFTYKDTYTYDTKGRLVEMTRYAGDSVDRRIYAYSGDARVPVELRFVVGNGKIYEHTIYSDYEFNSKGDWIKRKETTEGTFNRGSVSIVSREIEYYPDNK